MANNYLRRFAEWATGLRRRLASKVIKALFAEEILGGQKLFISNVAHELRTPLSTIKTVSEVSLLDPGLPRDTRNAFVEIVGELTRVSDILDNLLTLNALTRQEAMRFQTLDMAVLVGDVAKRLTPLARERGIRLMIRPQVGALAVGNRAALEAAVHHIIKNALSFTPAHEGHPVVVRVAPQDALVELVVEDHGIGMSREDILHALEPFYRADVSRNRGLKQQGSGLGLTIAGEMVRLHQGTLDIESKRHVGTTVTIRLPRGGFTSGSVASQYSDVRSATSKNGAHEPHSGRRYLGRTIRVMKGIAGT